MILIDGVRYELTTPKNEVVLEKAIHSNCEHIFGPDSFYFDIKSKLKSRAGVVSIPDGYVIYFTSPRKARWAIIEVELASHPVYEHVVPQLSKFNRGIEDGSTKRKLVEVLYSIFDEDEVLKARLKQRIKSGEVYKFISDLISEKPLIVVAIDQRTEQLDEGLHDIRGDVRVVEFKTFRREGVSESVNAYLFEPIQDKTIVIPPTPIHKSGRHESGGQKSSEDVAPQKKNRCPAIDDRTFELVRDNPGRYSIEEIFEIIRREYPDHDPDTLLRTTRRRLHGHLQKKMGFRIEKNAAGKYFVVE
jgi:hypothetical protein